MAKAISKAKLVEAIAEESGVSKAEIEKVLSGFLAATTKLLVEGNAVAVPGLAKFETRDRPARQVRMPGSDKIIDKPADKAVKITALSTLKDAVNR
jgi:DNA-binding protein HU-beta